MKKMNRAGFDMFILTLQTVIWSQLLGVVSSVYLGIIFGFVTQFCVLIACI